MAKTIFDINQNDLSSEQLNALQKKASVFLGDGNDGEVEEVQGNVVQEVDETLKEGFSLEESVGQLRNSLEEKIFGTPDINQKVIIKRIPKELRKKLEGKLFFSKDTIEIIIGSGKKLVFDKQQKFTEPSDWQTAMDIAKSIKQRLLTKEEFEGLFDLFKIGENYYGDELKKILGIAQSLYWSSTTNAINPSYAWYGHFYYGSMGSYDKYNTYRHTLCVHD